MNTRWWCTISEEFRNEEMVLDFLAITCWIIWKNRNKEHQNPDPMSAISTITKIMRSAMFKIRFALGGALAIMVTFLDGQNLLKALSILIRMLLG